MARKKAEEPDMSELTNEAENAEVEFHMSEQPHEADAPESGPPQDSDVSAESSEFEVEAAELLPDGNNPFSEDIVMDVSPTVDAQAEAEDAALSVDASEDTAQQQAAPRPSKRKAAPRKKIPEEMNEVEASPEDETADQNSPPTERNMRRPTRRRSSETQILTIESRAEVETPEERVDVLWHEIQNALRTRKILTGVLGGIEQNEARKTIAIVYYKELRVAIPLVEMNITLAGTENQTYDEIMRRQNKILGNMLGAEIDFIVRGIDAKSRSVVGSRREAMLKKRQLFYFGTDANGLARLYEDRIVQARVIAVAEKGIRVEIFGVECSVMARDLSWDWLGDAHERYSVGDEILVRIVSIRRESLEDIKVRADVRSVTGESGRENLKNCKVQGKYAGTVTDIHKGVVFVRLSIGVNAIAHSCYDRRTPGKKDEVSFAVTHIDEEKNVAVGIITRIIKQRL